MAAPVALAGLLALGGTSPADASEELGEAKALSELGMGLDLFTGEVKHKQLIAVGGDVRAERGKETNLIDHVVYAESVARLQTRVALEASGKVSYGGFTGKVSSSWERATSSSTKSHFMRKTVGTSESRTWLEYPGDQDTLEATTAFGKDLHDPKRSPAHLFEVYGTHVIMEYDLGGSAHLEYTAKQSAQMTREKFMLAVEASYSGVVNKANKIEGGSKYSHETIQQASQLQSDMHISMNGGTLRTMSDVQTKKTPEAWAAWQATVGDHPVRVRLDPTEQLPIWVLCKDSKRAKQLRDAFETEIALRAIRHPIHSESKRFTSTEGMTFDPFPKDKKDNPSYKIISGGVMAGGRVVASHPKRGYWYGKGTGGQAYISTFSIYDPHDHWEVKVVRGDDKNQPDQPFKWKAHDDVSHGDNSKVLERTRAIAWCPEGYFMTGGGAEAKTARFNLTSSAPIPRSVTLAGRTLGYRTQAEWDQGVEDICSSIEEKGAVPVAWYAESQDYYATATDSLTAYVVCVRPRSEVAKRLVLTSRLFVERGPTGKGTTAIAGRFGGKAYHLVGGGALIAGLHRYVANSGPQMGKTVIPEWAITDTSFSSDARGNIGSGTNHALAIGISAQAPDEK